MEKIKKPSDISYELTDERLFLLGALIRETKENVLSHSKPEFGDESWCIGCRSYSWIRKSIINVSQNDPKFSGWLKVWENDNLNFTFLIGNVPVKIYSATPDNIPSRSYARRYSEILAQQEAFDFYNVQPRDTVLRLLIEYDGQGFVDKVMLVEVAINGEIANKFEIPENLSNNNVKKLRKKAVEINPPNVKPKKEKLEKKDTKED